MKSSTFIALVLATPLAFGATSGIDTNFGTGGAVLLPPTPISQQKMIVYAIAAAADGKIIIEAKQDIEITGDQAISVEAQGQLTLKGQAGVKIQSSGVVDIDGSVIQLN